MSAHATSKICLDASTVLALVLPDEPFWEKAIALMKELASRNILICAPALLAYECNSVIRLRMYKGMSLMQAQKARAVINALPIKLEYDAANEDRAFQISCDYDQPRAYDAAYAAYAESRGVELVTADRPFFEAVNGSKRPQKTAALSFVKLLS